jgi:protein TonB
VRQRIVLTENAAQTLKSIRWRHLQETSAFCWPGAASSALVYVLFFALCALCPQTPRASCEEVVHAVEIGAPPALPVDPQPPEPKPVEKPREKAKAEAPPLPEPSPRPPDPAPAPRVRVEPAPEAPVPATPAPVPSAALAMRKTAPLPVADEGAVRSNYWTSVRAAIAGELTYPPVARRRGLEGMAAFRITLDGQGRLLDARPVQTTGAVFENAALAAIRRAAPFAPPPGSPSATWSAAIPIRFRLLGEADSFLQASTQ